MMTVKTAVLSFLLIVSPFAFRLSAQEEAKPRNLLFFDTVLFSSRFELYGMMDHDIVDVVSPGIQVTYFKSFKTTGVFVQTTMLFPSEAKIDPSVGSGYSDDLEGGLRIGVDMLAGPGWIIPFGPMIFMVGGGVHFSFLIMGAEYGYSSGLGLSGRAIVPFSKNFHMQMGVNLCYDLVGDMVYGSYSHNFYRGYTAGFSAGFGLNF